MQTLVTCPDCKKQLRVPDELLGTAVQCPECNHMFTASSAGDDEPPEPKASRRNRDDDHDDDLDVRKPSQRGGKKPDKVATLGVLALVGGIFAVILFLSLGGGSAGFCCLWPGTYYSLVVGIMAIIRGAGLLGSTAHQYPVPSGIAIMMIINIINLDILNLVLGIVMLTMCGDEEVNNYLAK